MTDEQLEIGALAPAFDAPDENGKRWDLTEALARSTQVLLFYRGDW